MFTTQHIWFPLFSVLSYDSYDAFWVKMATLFGVSILVTIYPELSKQTLLCNKHNVSNLILRYPHIAPEGFDNATITGHFGFVFEENSVKDITW